MEWSENFDFFPPGFISRLYVEVTFKKPSKLMSCSSWVLLQTVMSSKYEKVPDNLSEIKEFIKCWNIETPICNNHGYSFKLI